MEVKVLAEEGKDGGDAVEKSVIGIAGVPTEILVEGTRSSWKGVTGRKTEDQW